MDANYTRDMARLQFTHWWYEGRRRVLSSIISGLGLDDAPKILEAGCGPGANLNMLSKFGEVSAFEPDGFSVVHAAGVSQSEVRKGALPDDIPFDEQFDLVCAFDVIEHIEDDLSSVRALYAVTKRGGYAVFTVPAFQFLWSRHDEVNHHYRRYTRKQLADVLGRAGYEVRFVSYYNFWLFPLAASVRLVKRLAGKKAKGQGKRASRGGCQDSDVKMPGSGMVNSLLCRIFSSERHVLKFTALPFGLSVLAVCYKP